MVRIKLLSTVVTLLVGSTYAQPKVIQTELDGGALAGLVYFNDSSTVLYHSSEGTIYRSDDDGSSWTKSDVKDVQALREHPFDKDRAYALTGSNKHYVTKDRGSSWQSFTVDTGDTSSALGISFHAENPDALLFSAAECTGQSLFDMTCSPEYFYTTDHFGSVAKLNDAALCQFARSSPAFKEGDANAIVCAVKGKIQVSNDFFKSVAQESDLDRVVGIGAAGKYFIALKALSADHAIDDRVELHVSTDLKSWHKAEFGDYDEHVKQASVTVLESSDHSLHVDVLTDIKHRQGTFFTSNSDGWHFTKSLEHTHRDQVGRVDIEALDGIDGVLIANADVDGKAQSRISFDDGRSWTGLETKGGNALHLHSVTDERNAGRIFSSPSPGIIAGIGNTGASLGDRNDGSMFVSHDSGLTWEKALDHSHLYEFGDQGNLLLAARDNQAINDVQYSTDRGESWQKLDLDKGVRAQLLITTPDSTSLKFLLFGGSGGKTIATSLDFTGAFDRACKFESKENDDFEKWYAVYDKDGTSACIMGHKQYFWRRKRSAKCYVGELYKEQRASFEQCACNFADFECDSGYVRQGQACVKSVNDCTSGEKLTISDTGLRKIPGNQCEGSIPSKIDYTCSEDGKKLQYSSMASDDGDEKDDKKKGDDNKDDDKKKGEKGIAHSTFQMEGAVVNYMYLVASDENKDETIVVLNDKHEVWITHDQGGKWERALDDKRIIAMSAHPTKTDYIYLLTSDTHIYISRDRGQNFKSHKLPAKLDATNSLALGLHKSKEDWMIYHGETGCDNPFSSSCRVDAYYSSDSGETWHGLQEDVQRCSFSDNHAEDLVLCSKFVKESGHKQLGLYSSTNWFKDTKEHFDNIIGFALEHEFIVVAAIDKEDTNSLKAFVSVDGATYAAADFPHNFKVDKQQAYTVLESKTKAVFLHVTVNNRAASEYGTLLKSNSNGTEYVISLEGLNRDDYGYVDFEKMAGLEGVAIANAVANTEEVGNGVRKKIKTKITHNDGAQWAYLTPPSLDANGNKQRCSGSLDQCSLNLHGFTERLDYRDTFSSQSAVGLMVGVGNVGPELASMEESNTYMTRDGGVSWVEVAKGTHEWEFGDSGGIVVLTDNREPTNKILYSLDEGKNWKEYEFSDDLIRVKDLATIPSDMSRKFLIFGQAPASKGRRDVITQIDFSGLTDRKCEINEEDPNNSKDFTLWAPSHPDLDNCLFGHEALYLRKKLDANCFVGRHINQPHSILQNCSCSRQDFECDFNYIVGNDGTCQLIPGYSPPDHSKVCDEFSDKYEYWEPTGYRRIPMSTCQGGNELDRIQSHPCPGKEKEYEEKHRGLHGFALFLVIVLPIGFTAAIGVIIWDHYSKRYGQIRLGEDNDDQPVMIQYMAIGIGAIATVVAAAVAVVSVIPALGVSLWNQAMQRFGRRGGAARYATRGAFARSSYAPVAVGDTDENELLNGGESDEDLEIRSDEE